MGRNPWKTGRLKGIPPWRFLGRNIVHRNTFKGGSVLVTLSEIQKTGENMGKRSNDRKSHRFLSFAFE